jgi:hypothetical protein
MTCHLTWKRLTNMVAASTTARETETWSPGAVEGPQSAHCKTSARQQPEEHHVEPDVNASRNILMLLMLEIRGFNRPAEFQPLPKRRAN